MSKRVDIDVFRRKSPAPDASGGDGGNMDDFSRRLGIVESLVAEIREIVSAIQAALPHLATKADLNDSTAEFKGGMNELKGDVRAINAIIPHLATKADLYALETRIVRGFIATVLAAVSATFAIARFVH